MESQAPVFFAEPAELRAWFEPCDDSGDQDRILQNQFGETEYHLARIGRVSTVFGLDRWGV